MLLHSDDRIRKKGKSIIVRPPPPVHSVNRNTASEARIGKFGVAFRGVGCLASVAVSSFGSGQQLRSSDILDAIDCSVIRSKHPMTPQYPPNHLSLSCLSYPLQTLDPPTHTHTHTFVCVYWWILEHASRKRAVPCASG